MPHDLRYECAYIFGAVCPTRDTGVALVLPDADIPAMNLHLQAISAHVDQDSHAAIIIDGAGWHKNGSLMIPDNLRLLSLPPYSPELNPVEHIWDDLREKEFHNRVFDSIDSLEDHLEKALHDMEHDHDRIRSIVAWPWIINALMN